MTTTDTTAPTSDPRFAGRFLFLDLETTALNPETGGILQAAVAVTDWKFDVIHREEWWVLNDPNSITFDNGALALHNRTGFLEQYLAAIGRGEGKDVRAMAHELAAVVRYHSAGVEAARGRGLVLAGANVESFDRKWLAKHAPGVVPMLHYRTLNTSSLRLVRASALACEVSDLTQTQSGQHFAPRDVELAIEEAKACREIFAKAAGK